MEDLIRYVAQFDPQFPQRIRGASAQEIARLEQLVGFPLPLTYRAFLAAMGHDVGGLDLAPDGISRISDIIEYYQCWVTTGLVELPPDSILICSAPIPAYDLVLQSCNGAAEPRVCDVEDGEMVGPRADSLEQLLFRLAFIRYQLNPLPYQCWYSNDRGTQQLQQAAMLTRSLSAHIHAFSDSLTLCAESEGMALYFKFFPERGGIAVRMGAVQPNILERIGPYFAEHLNLQRRD